MEKTTTEKIPSALVSLKTAAAVLGSSLSAVALLAIPIFSGNSLDAVSANLIGESGSLTGSEEFIMTFVHYLTLMGVFIGGLFLSIFVLYILAKVEGQDHGDIFHEQAKSYAYKNFPSVFVLEATTMLYVILIIIASTLVIAKLNFGNGNEITHSDNFLIVSSMAFAILGGALSQLYYFLNKVETKDVHPESSLESRPRKIHEFDINRVLRYLSFPFMSAGMGILAFTMVKGTGSVLGFEGFSNPSYWFLMFMALTSGYFCDLFIIIFQKTITKMENNFLNGKNGDANFQKKAIPHG